MLRQSVDEDASDDVARGPWAGEQEAVVCIRLCGLLGDWQRVRRRCRSPRRSEPGSGGVYVFGARLELSRWASAVRPTSDRAGRELNSCCRTEFPSSFGFSVLASRSGNGRGRTGGRDGRRDWPGDDAHLYAGHISTCRCREGCTRLTSLRRAPQSSTVRFQAGFVAS